MLKCIESVVILNFLGGEKNLGAWEVGAGGEWVLPSASPSPSLGCGYASASFLTRLPVSCSSCVVFTSLMKTVHILSCPTNPSRFM